MYTWILDCNLIWSILGVKTGALNFWTFKLVVPHLDAQIKQASTAFKASASSEQRLNALKHIENELGERTNRKNIAPFISLDHLSSLKILFAVHNRHR